MEEIKVGEYARTEEGEIFRVIEEEVDFYNFQIKKLNPKEIWNPIVKHSSSITDLIEKRRLCKRRKSILCIS